MHLLREVMAAMFASGRDTMLCMNDIVHVLLSCSVLCSTSPFEYWLAYFRYLVFLHDSHTIPAQSPEFQLVPAGGELLEARSPTPESNAVTAVIQSPDSLPSATMDMNRQCETCGRFGTLSWLSHVHCEECWESWTH